MTVYVVWEDLEGDRSTIVGVFSTKERAEACIARFNKDEPYFYPGIDEFELDAE